MDRYDKTEEKRIAESVLKSLGGEYVLFQDDFAPHDRMWKGTWRGKTRSIFVECRHRTDRLWNGVGHYSGVFVNSTKLENPFLFAVSDAAGKIIMADINLRRLMALRELPVEKLQDQGGTWQEGVDVPYKWFENLS
jgi:hypothetical protein